MVPVSFVIWIAIIEAVVFIEIIYCFIKPTKELRESIRDFADEHGMSDHAAMNWILKFFFNAYENGLRGKIRIAHMEAKYEEWKAKQDDAIIKELNKDRKQIVKPRKIEQK